MSKAEQYGLELYEALRGRQSLTPLVERDGDLTVDDAYAISLDFLARRVKDGEKVVGKKIGVTSKAVQDMLGVHQPDFGFLTDWMFVEGDIDVDAKGSVNFNHGPADPQVIHWPDGRSWTVESIYDRREYGRAIFGNLCVEVGVCIAKQRKTIWWEGGRWFVAKGSGMAATAI